MGVRMGPSGLLLLLLATLACAALGQQECPANPYVPGGGCSPEPNICQLTCAKTEDCVQTVPESCLKASVDSTVSYNDMNPTKCEELCGNSNENDDSEATSRCRFWRYEVGTGQSRICSLMKDADDQCNAYQHCPPAQSENPEEGCVTEDVGCPGGVTPPPPTMPADTVCFTVSRCADW